MMNLKQADRTAQTNVGIDSLTGEVKDIATNGHASWTTWFITCEVCEDRCHSEREGLEVYPPNTHAILR